ncbi:MAG: DUF4914 family protein [Thermoleophilia bacterium]|nr:DUF4914 family protein [Thermoleophilia bacterium]
MSDVEAAHLPAEIRRVLEAAPSLRLVGTTEELLSLATGGPDIDRMEVSYQLPDGTEIIEAEVARVRNGIAVNYTDPYMRRRDPDCLYIGDHGPTGKPRFIDHFGSGFATLRHDTLRWLAFQDLAAFYFRTGFADLGASAVAVVPANAAFFGLGLAMLQGIIPLEEISEDFKPTVFLFVAPPYRHTHFAGKQVVVHNRIPSRHEIFSYNLYPGPSAKKGVYGTLIRKGAREGWVAAHCSAVRVITPYDNVVTFMHEGASGGGKSEMLEQPHRLPDGRLLKGRNLLTGEERHLEIPRTCELEPVCDDMAMCHPSFQKKDGRLWIADAEDAWFVRVDHIKEYGTDPDLEKLTAAPATPLLFLNIDAVPGSRALIWEHTLDAPGEPCPNPRLIIPRRVIPHVVDEPVPVDVRSMGVRTPPCTKEKPTYGIIGLFHVLPPALAWLWRLVAPRGHANPSIVDGSGMASEGVGSYWPFATENMVDQANLLLAQFLTATRTRYILVPNQHIGVWRTGFMPQWLARDYLARRGIARFRPGQLSPSRCPLLGYSLTNMRIEGVPILPQFLQVETQPEVGLEAYDAGAAQLTDFFERHLQVYLTPALDPKGREIIECCLRGGSVQDYAALVPGFDNPTLAS